MRCEEVVLISAPAEAIWDLLVDLESWPEMTASMTSLERLDPGPLAVGSRVRIKQPSLPAMQWTVTELVEGQRFVWESPRPGVRTRAGHHLLEVAGETTLRLEVEQTGPLGWLVGLLTRSLTERYLEWECQGFKKWAEGTR